MDDRFTYIQFGDEIYILRHSDLTKEKLTPELLRKYNNHVTDDVQDYIDHFWINE
jgi:hypothetical protein